jgi:hypothetical protein
LHTLTSSTVWLDMRQNIYKKEYEYLDPSKGYGEQSPIEYRRDCDYEGHCIEKCFYTKRLGNHFILKEEAFSTFDTHLVNCVCIPLEASLSRRSYIRLFHPADDDHLAQADETHTKSYEASDEEKNADEKMAKEMVEIDSAELDDMRRKADIPRWKPVEPFEKKWIVLRPPKAMRRSCSRRGMIPPCSPKSRLLRMMNRPTTLMRSEKGKVMQVKHVDYICLLRENLIDVPAPKSARDSQQQPSATANAVVFQFLEFKYGA